MTATCRDEDDHGRHHMDGWPRRGYGPGRRHTGAQSLQARGPTATTGAVTGWRRSVEPSGEAGGAVFVTDVSSDQKITPVLSGQT